jgi:hypothetical protein
VHGLLGLPDDVKVIILSDSDEEEEVHEEDITDVEAAPPSAMKSLVPTASVADADGVDKGMPDDSHGGHSPDRAIGGSNSGRDEVDSP